MNGEIFSRPFDTPFGAVPFDRITVADYMPAFEEARYAIMRRLLHSPTLWRLWPGAERCSTAWPELSSR